MKTARSLLLGLLLGALLFSAPWAWAIVQTSFGALDGTVAAPAFYFHNDTDNGLFRSGANAWSIVAGGVSQIDITATGITVTGTQTVTGAQTFTGAASFNGAVTLGDAAADNITVTGSLTSNLIFAEDTARTIRPANQATAATAGDALTVQGGLGNTTGAGGQLNLTGGIGGNDAVGGAIVAAGGAAGGGNRAGGLVSLTGGASTGSGTGGTASLVGGAGSAATGVGGAAFLTGGAGNTTGAGGQVNITGGAGGNDAVGGALVAAGGAAGGGNRAGGLASLTGGAGAGTAAGGAASLVGGASGGAAGDTADGGAVTITGGAATPQDGDGGTVTITGGTAVAGAGTENGGNVIINGGDGADADGTVQINSVATSAGLLIGATSPMTITNIRLYTNAALVIDDGSVAAGACEDTATVTAGIAATDNFIVTYVATPAAALLGLSVSYWPTAGNINATTCNGNAGAVNPGTVNVRVIAISGS